MEIPGKAWGNQLCRPIKNGMRKQLKIPDIACGNQLGRPITNGLHKQLEVPDIAWKIYHTYQERTWLRRWRFQAKLGENLSDEAEPEATCYRRHPLIPQPASAQHPHPLSCLHMTHVTTEVLLPRPHQWPQSHHSSRLTTHMTITILNLQIQAKLGKSLSVSDRSIRMGCLSRSRFHVKFGEISQADL